MQLMVVDGFIDPQLELEFTPARSQKRLGPLRWFFAMVVIGLLMGCEQEEGNRRAVTGKITLDGVSLAIGHVTFIPVQRGTTSAGPIREGAYRIDAANGLVPGAYSVEISSPRDTGKKIKNDPDEPAAPIMAESVPPRYNRITELSAEVTAKGPNEFDFKLESK